MRNVRRRELWRTGLSVVAGICGVGAPAFGAQVFALANSTELLMPYDESLAIREMRSGRFPNVPELDKWTNDVFSCFRESSDTSRRLVDVRLMWCDGDRLLIVERYGQAARIEFLGGERKPVVGWFDAIRFERLMRTEVDLASLLLQHTLLGLDGSSSRCRAEWMRVCWLIIDTRSRHESDQWVSIRVRQFGATLEVLPGEVKAALFPDEGSHLPVEIPYDGSSVGVRVSVYKASDLPARWATKFPPPRGFDRVRVITVESSSWSEGGAMAARTAEAGEGGSSSGATGDLEAPAEVVSPYTVSAIVLLLGSVACTYLAYRWRERLRRRA